jgi:hypothetical protein
MYKVKVMKRRSFFSIVYIVLIVCFLNELIIPVPNGRTGAIGAAVIIVGIIIVERLVMYITNRYEKREEDSDTSQQTK